MPMAGFMVVVMLVSVDIDRNRALAVASSWEWMRGWDRDQQNEDILCSSCQPVIESLREELLSTNKKLIGGDASPVTIVGKSLRDLIALDSQSEIDNVNNEGKRQSHGSFCSDWNKTNGKLSRYQSAYDVWGVHYFRRSYIPNYNSLKKNTMSKYTKSEDESDANKISKGLIKYEGSIEKSLSSNCRIVMKKLEEYLNAHDDAMEVHRQNGVTHQRRLQDENAYVDIGSSDKICASHLLPHCSTLKRHQRIIASMSRLKTLLWLSPFYIILGVIPLLFVNAYMPIWMPGKRDRLKKIFERKILLRQTNGDGDDYEEDDEDDKDKRE